MLGLGTSVIKGAGRASNLGIVTDNLILKHNYNAGRVHQVSTGAADINSDADANEYISVGTITIGTGDISVSAWVYVTTFTNLTSTYGGIITNRQTASTSPGIQLRVKNNSTIEMLIDDGGSDSTIASGTLNTHQWYHVCGVWDRSDKQFLYIDGVLVNSGDITNENLTLNHSENVLIGRLDTTGYDFMGYICNVGYWNRVLSQAEVKSIMWKNYADLTSAETTSLVSWWNLDSAIDSTETVGVGSTTVYDNHHGGGDTLGANLVTSYEVVGTQATSKWIAFPDDGSALLTSDNNILTATIGGGANSANEGARYEVTGLSGYAAGKTYKVQADLWLGTYEPDPTGAFRIQLGASGKNITLSTTRTTFTVYITTTDTSDLIFYQDDADNSVGTFFIANVSLQLVNGNTGILS